ncbi:MAG: FAD binding domain-containing protein [Chloroflexota bacterium]
MAALEYHRPKTISEALSLLKQGVPLAGGTILTPNRRGLRAVVDLQDLGLNAFEIRADDFAFGAMVSLQALVEAADRLPAALVAACRLEAGWNIRNQATLGGTVASADGRSPLLTTLLAMGAELELAPEGMRASLDELLETGGSRTQDRPFGLAQGKLMTAIHVRRPERLAYEQVARSPADRPLVCAAAALFDRAQKVRVALGGFGSRPILVDRGEDGLEGTLERAGNAAQAAYSRAADAWAGAEFRSAVADTLVRRVVSEVLTG